MNRWSLAVLSVMVVPALASAFGAQGPRPAVMVPVRATILPWETPRPPLQEPTPQPRYCPVTTHGSNAVASAVRLASDFEAARGYQIVAEVANTGTDDLSDLLLHFYLGDPDSDGILIGEVVIASLPSGGVVCDSTHWPGFTGSGILYAVVDPTDEVIESDESDNRAALAVSLRDDVPWVWQVVNGYCNFAGLTMQFNFLGCDHTLYETVEFCSVPHSAIGIDDRFYLPGGLMICQSESDYEFAGTIRNLAADFAYLGSWNAYMAELRGRVDAGHPCLTSVDPYYLPQPDYDVLRLYDLHAGHAVVVTGYADSAVVLNDPGVGLDFIDPGLPEPEKRGADVVVDLATFRQAVEGTSGGVYVLISFSPQGPIPPEEDILAAAILQSIDRLAGLSYDPGWEGIWPQGWTPVFGMAAFDTLQRDMTVETFSAWFQEVSGYAGGDLEETIMALAAAFSDGMFWTRLGWEASEAYYATLQSPEAPGISAMSGVMAQRADAIFNTYIALLMTLMANGGNPNAAGPYLSAMAAELADINELEPQVRHALMRMAGMGGDGPAVPRDRALAAFPNPFTSRTQIRWQARGDAITHVGIFDLAGRLVRDLGMAEGMVMWDGTDCAARFVTPGTYVIRDGSGRSLRLVRTD